MAPVRLVPAALGVAIGLAVTGLALGPRMHDAESAVGFYDAGDGSNGTPDFDAVEGLIVDPPTTAPAPTSPPVDDLGTIVLDLAAHGFTASATPTSPFDGPMDLAEASSFAADPADVDGFQRALEARGFVRGHGVLGFDGTDRILGVVVLEFATAEGAREHFEGTRRAGEAGGSVASVSGVADGFSVAYPPEEGDHAAEASLLDGSRVFSVVLVQPGAPVDLAELDALVVEQEAVAP